MYKMLKSAGVGKNKKTLVYPEWVREAVRNRFLPGGQHDAQYANDPKIIVSVFCEYLQAWHPNKISFCCNFPVESAFRPSGHIWDRQKRRASSYTSHTSTGFPSHKE